MSSNKTHFPESEDQAAMSPGARLHKIRQERGLSVEVVSEATKISIKNIRAIEDQDWEQLPADTFVRGLVNLYANFLSLDGAEIAAEFLAGRGRENNRVSSTRKMQPRKQIASSSLAPKKLAEPAHISSATVALVLLALIVLSFTGFCVYTSWNPFAFLTRQTKEIQQSMPWMFGNQAVEQEETAARGNVKELQTDVPSDTSTTTPDAAYTLTAFFLKNSAVTIRLDGQKPVHRTFREGEKVTWLADNALEVIFEAPDVALLTLNGSPLSFPRQENNQPPTLTLPEAALDQ